MSTQTRQPMTIRTGATEEEWQEFVDYVMTNCLKNPQSYRLDFTEMGDLWTPQGMKILGKKSHKWLDLKKIIGKINYRSRYSFWHMVFVNHEYFDREDILKLWYQSYTGNYCPQIYEDKLAKQDKDGNMVSPLFDNPVLLENRSFCHRYCDAGRPGYTLIRHMFGRRTTDLSLPQEVKTAIEKDDAATFIIHCDMGSADISFSLLAQVIQARDFKIFEKLLAFDRIPKSVITLEELACMFTLSMPDYLSVPFLKILESVKPGVLASVKDPFGRNLLWFAMLNEHTGWFHPSCKLTQLLLECGCDPQNTNLIGLTWQEVKDWMKDEQKVSFMIPLYNMSINKAQRYDGHDLKKEQPLDQLTSNPYLLPRLYM